MQGPRAALAMMAGPRVVLVQFRKMHQPSKSHPVKSPFLGFSKLLVLMACPA